MSVLIMYALFYLCSVMFVCMYVCMYVCIYVCWESKGLWKETFSEVNQSISYLEVI